MKNYLLFKARASYKLHYPITFLLAFWLTTTSAQNVPITGTVNDAQGALPSVNVTLTNKSTATFTIFVVNSGIILVISGVMKD